MTLYESVYRESNGENPFDDEMQERILDMFDCHGMEVVNSDVGKDDEGWVFEVECGDSNVSQIENLQNYLYSVTREMGNIGFDSRENGNGFYGRTFVFYEYE